MSATSVTVIGRPPAKELIEAVAELFRVGLPPLLESPTWAPGAAAPAGHWLVPEGTKLYGYDVAAKVESPALIIEQTGKAVREYPNSGIYWKIPIHVSLMLSRTVSADEILGIQGKILRMLTEELPTGNPRTVTAPGRLTAAGQAWAERNVRSEYAQVWPRGMEEVDVDELESKSGHAGVRVTLTVKCSTATLLPSAA